MAKEFKRTHLAAATSRKQLCQRAEVKDFWFYESSASHTRNFNSVLRTCVRAYFDERITLYAFFYQKLQADEQLCVTLMLCSAMVLFSPSIACVYL